MLTQLLTMTTTHKFPPQGCRTGKQFPVCVGDKAFVYKTKLAPFSHRIHLTFPNDPNGQVWGADNTNCYVWTGTSLDGCSTDAQKRKETFNFFTRK